MKTQFAIAILVAGLVIALSNATSAAKTQQAPTVTSTIARAGSQNIGVGVDSATHRIYVGWFDPVTRLPSISVIDSSTQQEIANIPLPEAEMFNQIEVNSKTGKVYAVDSSINILYIIDPLTKTFVKGPQQVNTGEAVAVDESTNLIYWTNGGVAVLDGTTGSLVRTFFQNDENIFDVELNPITHRLYATSTGANKVHIVDLNNNSVVTSVDVQEALWAAINPVTNRIYVTSYLHPQVTVIDGATSHVIATIMPTGEARNPLDTPRIAVNSATNLLYITNSESNTVDIVDGGTNQVINTVAVSAAPLSVVVDESTGRVYVSQPAFLDNGPSVVSVIANTPPSPNTLPETGGSPGTTSFYTSWLFVASALFILAGAAAVVSTRRHRTPRA